jgi:hypothetical protein
MTSILVYQPNPKFNHFVYKIENTVLRGKLHQLLQLNGVSKYSLGWVSEDPPQYSTSNMANYDQAATVIDYGLLKTDVELTKHIDDIVINTKLVVPETTGMPVFVSSDNGVWIYKLNGTTYAQLYDLAKKAGVDKWDGATHPRAYLHRSFGANHNPTLTGLVRRAVDNYPYKPSPYFYCDADLFGTKTKEEAPKMDTPVNTPVKTTNVGKFIVWSPQSKKPPTVILNTENEARAVCKKMSDKNPGNEFYYAKLSGGTVVTVTTTEL